MIIQTILQKLGIGDGSFNRPDKSRRKHIRHPGAQAEVVVADRAISLSDWSMGGMFFQPPPGLPLVAGDKLQFRLRFRLPHETVEIVQPGRIVRSVRRGVAAEFLPLTSEARRKLERVLDGVHAQGFLASQTA